MNANESNAELALLPLALANVPTTLRRALEQEGVPTVAGETESSAARFVLFDSGRGRQPQLAAGQTAIDIAALRRGESPDPFAALDDERSTRARWQAAGLDLTEQVAAIDKHAVRRRLLSKLRLLIEEAGGVWACLAAFPFPYRSAFNLRVDYDRYEPGDFAAFWQAIRGHENAVSHFVCAAAVLPQPDLLGRLVGCDVGSHGYHHHTYRDEAENLTNMRRGIEALQTARIDPSGFAAPHGRWSPALARCLNSLGISHSSEFALAYDELPFWPRDCRALQIPVHPVCLGLFLEAADALHPARDRAAVAELAANYWRHVAAAKYAAGQPIFLYDHPDGRLGRHPQVVSGLLAAVSQFAAIWPTTLTGFARWWRARQRVSLRLAPRGDAIAVQTANLPNGYRLGLEYWRGGHVAVLPIHASRFEFSPTALAYQSRPSVNLPAPVRLAGSPGVKGRLRRYLDWELETPLSEIGTRTWPGWIKHKLRSRRDAREVRA